MDQDIKRRWLEALRSGKYAQNKGSLRQARPDGTFGFCCLGVLCDVVMPEAWDSDASPYHNACGGGYPSEEIRRVAELGDVDPAIKGVEISGQPQVTLSILNDAGYSFEAIADLIEVEL